jgi:hypothetical protein
MATKNERRGVGMDRLVICKSLLPKRYTFINHLAKNLFYKKLSRFNFQKIIKK